MVYKGIVKPTVSQWTSPVVLLRKAILCRPLTADTVTTKNVYPLPRIDLTLYCLPVSSHFSTIQLRIGYRKIPIHYCYLPKTAFLTPDGLYNFNVLPFVLDNATGTFERMINSLLRGLNWSICICYLDDVIIFSSTFAEHPHRPRRVLDCFRTAELQL